VGPYCSLTQGYATYDTPELGVGGSTWRRLDHLHADKVEDT